MSYWVGLWFRWLLNQVDKACLSLGGSGYRCLNSGRFCQTTAAFLLLDEIEPAGAGEFRVLEVGWRALAL
jgi:hypothetical protein